MGKEEVPVSRKCLSLSLSVCVCVSALTNVSAESSKAGVARKSRSTCVAQTKYHVVDSVSFCVNG